MAIARRVYLYAIALVALGMLVSGLAGLATIVLTLAVANLAPPLVVIGAASARAQISLAIALTTIGLIAWIIHWGLAERAVVRETDDDAERRSAIRRLFLYAAILIGGLMLTGDVRGIVEDALLALGGRLTPGDLLTGHLVEPLAHLGVTAPIWIYHVRIAARDRARSPEVGAGATLRRWCLYVLSLFGLVPALFAAARLIGSLWEAVAPSPGVSLGPGWLTLAAGGQVAGLLAGLALWLGAWGWSNRWLAATDGADPESRSTLRKVYLYLVLAIAMAWTIWNLGRILYLILQTLLIADPVDAPVARLVRALGEPVGIAIVFGVAWVYHVRVVRREAALAGEPRRQAAIRWIYEYLAALVGLVTLAIGAGGTLATLIDWAVQPGAVRPSHWLPDQISLFATLIVVGLPLWLIAWRPIQREAADPIARRSLVRRIYLLLAIGGGVLTILGGGAFALYQIVRLALGDRWSAGQISEWIAAASAAGVAALVVIYHLRELRRDLAGTATEPAGLATVAIARIRAGDPEVLRAFRRELTARTPAGVSIEVAEVDAAVADHVWRAARRGDRPPEP